MTFSLNEVQALSKRAARGAGMSWGLSEDASSAVRWLASFNFDAASHFADLLDLHQNADSHALAPMSLTGEWTGASGALCPITAGASLCDCATRLGAGKVIALLNLNYPLLLAGFAADIARQTGKVVELRWDTARLTTDGTGMAAEGADLALNCDRTARVTCTLCNAMRPALDRTSRSKLDPDVLSRLNVYAHRTYAPATEESRKLGAG
jgi:hypothetical protein